MALYELLLFIHIAAAIVWVGSGFLIQVQAHRANRARDAGGLKRVADDSAALSMTVFIPSSLVVVVVGVLLVIESDAWGFDQLWIVLGLAGYFATFLTGVLVLKPRSEKLAEDMGREGMSSSVVTQIREIIVLARIDFLVLLLVVFVMAVKPTGDDPVVLIGMSAVLVAGVVFFLSQLKTLQVNASAGAGAPPASAAP